MRYLILLLSPIGLLHSPNASAADFIRGDVNSDGIVDITDVSAHSLEFTDLDGNGEDDSITVDAESVTVTRNGVRVADDAA